jgi:glycosyltransferase involved in cell wall biosynthesis
MTAQLPTAPGSSRPAAPSFPLIVQSHLRWDFVWQRPQQLLSRMAESAPVLFVEEPILLDDVRGDRLEITQPMPNVYRAVPRLPAYLNGDYDRSVATVRALVQQAIDKNGPLAGKFSNAVQWFYTPMPAPGMLGAFNELGVVYDCMDELSQFRFAPTDLGAREQLLLDNADVVFTGGHRLYESKRRFHSNVHFFGCGVDAAHFGAARALDTPVPADVPTDRARVLGFYGVIDERLDYQLIARLAADSPDASIVMVGPVVKIDPRDLPQAPNLHWLGQRDYSQLPGYVKAFDVCLMPFALNEATEYINPTKTLEYMAAGKPIVSTAVADVVRNFTPVVSVADSHDAFVRIANELAAAPSAELVARGVEQAAAATWESAVAQMRALITSAVRDSETRVDEVAAPLWREPATAPGATARATAGAQEELSA